MTLPGGRRVSGTIGGVHGSCVVRAVYSRLGPKHRLRAWGQVLTLAAAGERTDWQAVTVGRAGPGRARRSEIAAPEAASATAVLARLVDLYDSGMREPLPVSTATSFAYAKERLAGSSVEVALDAAAREWVTKFGGEQADADHQLVWGQVPLTTLLGAAPSTAERGALASLDETTRFGALACCLWEPVLDAERLVTP